MAVKIVTILLEKAELFIFGTNLTAHMRKINLVSLFCLTFFPAFTQRLLPEFGKIEKADLPPEKLLL